MRKIKVCPSLLAADFSQLNSMLKMVETADMLHFDVMDGHFVDNLSFGCAIAKDVGKISKLPQDVHLMVTNPLKFIPQFAEAGACNITFHIESDDNPLECIKLIKSFGIKASVSLNPNTKATAIYPLKNLVDMVLQMTVYPGFGGQELVEDALDNVRVLREFCGEDFNIQVDGGINLGNVKKVIDCGANVIVAGTAIFGSENPEQACNVIKNGGIL